MIYFSLYSFFTSVNNIITYFLFLTASILFLPVFILFLTVSILSLTVFIFYPLHSISLSICSILLYLLSIPLSETHNIQLVYNSCSTTAALSLTITLFSFTISILSLHFLLLEETYNQTKHLLVFFPTFPPLVYQFFNPLQQTYDLHLFPHALHLLFLFLFFGRDVQSNKVFVNLFPNILSSNLSIF